MTVPKPRNYLKGLDCSFAIEATNLRHLRSVIHPPKLRRGKDGRWPRSYRYRSRHDQEERLLRELAHAVRDAPERIAPLIR